MRLGGPIFESWADPEGWAAAHRKLGYGAAYCPLRPGAPGEQIAAFAKAAGDAGLVISEVGAWSNPVSPVASVRQRSIAHCQASLALADEIGARTCVTISGARGPQDEASLTSPGWDGPHPDNYAEDIFDLIVETTRQIIDAVKPRRSCFALETMPWMYPDSPESYLELLHAIDRPTGFGVHLDPVNMVNSPQVYFANTGLLRTCFELLGPHIKSCHAKDIRLAGKLTVHLDEVCPGEGALDYPTYLEEASRLHPDLPIMLEHLPTAADYDRAAAHLRQVARDLTLEWQ
ncbi:MAG: sugar phosphate isomerase/epimerase [Candidatus Latescibacteria bacterium]|nr:sugar phosphate isomerase/epimerase [Candidatus Latescibacterota bacterium]